MQSNVNFVTDGLVVYHLAGNDWYAVEQDDDKVMLVDTDCKIGDEKLETPWSDGNCMSADGKNGQAILDYVNRIADKYFNDIKYAIVPETVFAGTGKLRNAYMWPMSKDEFDVNKVVGDEIVRNTHSAVWTRTFNSIFDGNNYHRAWFIYSPSGDLYDSYCVNFMLRVAPAFYLKKSAIDHITEDGEIILLPDPLKFVADGIKTYHLAGNDWYVVTQDDDKVMLVDTDCKIGDEKLETHWSDGGWTSKEGENGEAVLDYCNNLVDTYFSGIKHVITPRTVNAGTGELENALMWPMSYEEFKEHRNIGGKIVGNSNSIVWTRTFSGVSSGNSRYAWCVNGSGGGLNGGGNVSNAFRVAPAFNLKKSSIDYITEDGEIVLKPEDNVN